MIFDNADCFVIVTIVFYCCGQVNEEGNDSSVVSKRRRSVPKRYLVCKFLSVLHLY